MPNSYNIETIKCDYSIPAWSALIALENKVFSLRVTWNTRAKAWFLSLYANDLEVTLVESRKVVLNKNLLSYTYNPLAPSGILVALADTADKITLENFGTDVQLHYITQIN